MQSCRAAGFLEGEDSSVRGQRWWDRKCEQKHVERGRAQVSGAWGAFNSCKPEILLKILENR